VTFPSLVLCDLPYFQISQVLSLCYAIPTSLLLWQDSGLVCFLLILLSVTVPQVADHLPNKHEALNSNPSITKKKWLWLRPRSPCYNSVSSNVILSFLCIQLLENEERTRCHCLKLAPTVLSSWCRKSFAKSMIMKKERMSLCFSEVRKRSTVTFVLHGRSVPGPSWNWNAPVLLSMD
jgi:hypothetical protein